jgi:predicted DNA-binding transcriptional regulator YafY
VLATSARLLELLALLQTRRDWSGAELAERLEVTPRTVRRDVERLRRLGYPVDAARGVAGGYRLGKGTELPPLLLDDEEAVAIAVGLRTAAGGSVIGIEETSVRALAKLEQMLPSRLRRRVEALGKFTVPMPGTGPTVDAETLVVLTAACRDHDRVRFRYEDYRGAASRRLVEPHRLVHAERRWYLVAWDVERAAWRTFRIDRMAGQPSPDGRFVPREPPAADVVAYVRRSIASSRGEHRASVILHAPLADVAGRVPYLVAALSALDDERCLLETTADWLGGLAVYVAAIGVEFEIVDSPAFAGEVGRLAERFARASELSAGQPASSTSDPGRSR